MRVPRPLDSIQEVSDEEGEGKNLDDSWEAVQETDVDKRSSEAG